MGEVAPKLPTIFRYVKSQREFGNYIIYVLFLKNYFTLALHFTAHV